MYIYIYIYIHTYIYIYIYICTFYKVSVLAPRTRPGTHPKPAPTMQSLGVSGFSVEPFLSSTAMYVICLNSSHLCIHLTYSIHL